jgi:hypothetical protein
VRAYSASVAVDGAPGSIEFACHLQDCFGAALLAMTTMAVIASAATQTSGLFAGPFGGRVAG